MPAKRKSETRTIIKTISASSRASVKVGDSFYTVEYHEERVIPEGIEVDVAKERKLLWDTVNSECDSQVEDILKLTKR